VKWRFGLLPVVCFVLLLCEPIARPQSDSATVTGRVADPTGATVAGATITILNVDTQIVSKTVTNENGLFIVSGLPPGSYRIEATKLGFKNVIKPDVILHLQDVIAINFNMILGSMSESVTVAGGASMLNTSDASVGIVVDRSYVENMPLNGRSLQDLILLAPGIVTTSPQVGAQTGLSGEFSVNGQRTESNYYTVDGVSANGGIAPGNPFSLGNSGSLPPATALGTTQGLVSLDALEEFRVQTSTYSAEYGRSPGGQFSFVTRSGTNQWHGTAFDYLRNDVFDANDWFNNRFGFRKSAERQNDFGGALGGPILIPGVYHGKERTFFFFSFEGLRLLQPQAAGIFTVPNASLRADAVGALGKVMNAFPGPNCASSSTNCTNDLGNGLGDFIGTWSNPNSLDALSIRLDHVVGNKLRLFFRFSNTPSSTAIRLASDVQSLAFATRTATFGATSVLSSRLSNELRLNYSSNEGTSSARIDSFGGATPVNLAQLQGIDTVANPFYEIDVDLLFGAAPALKQYVQASSQHQWNIVDTTSFSVGRHQLKFGVDYRRLAPTLGRTRPDVIYSYYAASSILTDSADSAFSISTGAGYPLYINLSAFAQDTWRLSARLTLSTGLRWEVNPAPGVTQGVKPYTVQGANSLASMVLAPQGTSLWQTSWHNFAPRLGVAYVLHDTPGHETVVRGGAGVFYDTGQQNGSFGFNGPGYSAFSVPTGQLSFPVASLSVPPAITNPPTPPYRLIYAFPPHLQAPYTLQTNVAVEQALGKSQTFTVSYVGAFARKLLDTHELNVGAVNPSFLFVNFFQSGHPSDYNALQTQLQRSLSSGLQALASYTWSHCIDYSSQNNSLLPYVRGNCNFDVRHNVSAAVSYDLPNAFSNHFARALLHHWGFDSRFNARTGFPVSFFGRQITDPATGQIQFSGLNLAPNIPLYLYGSQYPGGRAVNPDAFVLPSSGIVGNAPRNFVRGFGAWQIDMALRREFPIHERLKLQFRAEAFNIFNHPSFGQIDSSFGSPTFGQATATLGRSLGGLSPLYQMGGPRSIQFALRLMF
jgi:carboxypeptidase family protein